MVLPDTINSRINKDRLITYSIILCILFYLFRSSLPVFKYPFFLFYFSLLVYTFFVIRNRIIRTIWDFARNFYLILLLAVILIGSFLFSQKLYLIVFKDSVNSVVLVSELFIMSVLIDNKRSARNFYNGLIISIVLFAVLISIDSIFKILNIITVNPVINLEASLLVLKDIDYNFAILPVILGMIGAIAFAINATSRLQKILYNLSMILFSAAILFSGSRRGIFVFGLILFPVLISQLMTFLKKEHFLKKLGHATRIYIFGSILLFLISLLFVLTTSYDFKNRVLRSIGSKNILSTKITITSKIFKYYQIINPAIIFTDFFGKLWTTEFNPLDPESGWGMRMHTIVYPLTGENVEIVPEGSKGYLMDKTCNPDVYAGDAFSYTVIRRGYEIKKNDLVEASVYCYMSEDFNGSWAVMVCGGKVLGNINGFDYDTIRKGTWQKLICQVSNVDDIIQAAFYFGKTRSSDFSGLTGYIIFAYPEIKSINTDYSSLDPRSGATPFKYKQVFPLTGPNVEIVPGNAKGYLIDSSSGSSTWNGDSYYYHYLGGKTEIHENESLQASVFCYMSEDCDGSWARIDCKGQSAGTISGLEYDLTKKGTWQKLTCNIEFLTDTVYPVLYFAKKGTTSFSNLTGYVIFAYMQVTVVKKEFDPKDPEKGWGKGIHRTVFPLKGENVEIVPEGTIGYLMDKTCKADTWDGNAYSYTIIKQGYEIKKNELAEASVYCYMSEDFNGSWARIVCGGKILGNINGSDYDIKRKGSWQKLTCQVSNVDDIIQAALYFSKTGTVNFSELTGYIIFAYPDIKSINTQFNALDPKSGAAPFKYKQVFPLSGRNVGIVPVGSKGYLIDSSINDASWNGNAYFYHDIGHNFIINEDQILQASVFCYMSVDCDGSWARIDCKGQATGTISGPEYDLTKKGTWQKLTCNVELLTDTISPVFYFSKSGTSSFSKLKGHAIFAYPRVEKVKKVFDPKDPDSGWGKRIHKTVFPLSGKNAEIVPSGAKGYLMDNSTNADTWDGNSYSHTLIRRGYMINRNEKVDASVYCYMSEDFNGSWAGIICKGQKTGTFDGINYDTFKKGTWQKLTCEISRITDRIDINIGFSKAGSTNFANLKGYIIFACPLVKKSVGNAVTDLKTSFQEFNHLAPAKYSRAGLGESAVPFLPLLFQESDKKEFIRDLAARLISEDTTYLPYKSDFILDTVKNDFIALRITQGHLALQIFIKEYNWKQKLFGGDYRFINWYGYIFTGDKTKTGYPHNPFLQVLLYSGILGLLIYAFFIFKAIYYYFRYYKEYPLLLIFYFAIFSFSIFSSGSPFDPPIMGFFSILPFLFHYIHMKE